MNYVSQSSIKFRRKKLIKRFLKFFSIPLLFLGFVVGLNYVPYLRLKNIEFSGIDILEKEKILAVLKNDFSGNTHWFFPKNSVFLTDEKKIAAKIADSFPEMDKIRVEKKYFSSNLLIAISKRFIFGLYCKKDECFFLDKSGVIFAPAPSMEGNAVLKFIDEREEDGEIELGAKPNIENFDNIFDFSVQISENQDFRITKLVIKSKDEIEIFTTQNWRLIIDNAIEPLKTKQNFEIALQNIKKKETLDYIDLRFGNKIYYKFKEN